MPAQAGPDIFQRFEREIRTPRRRLLVDSLLPPPESIESAVTPPPPPPPLPGESLDETRLFERLDAEAPEPEEKPKPRRKAVPAHKKKTAEKSLSLQEEIEEFMKRGGGALAPEEGLGPFQPPPIAPTPQTQTKDESGPDPSAKKK